MGDDDLVEIVMNSLLGRLVDSSHVVRQMCIRGLGNIASIGKAQVMVFINFCTLCQVNTLYYTVEILTGSLLIPQMCTGRLGNIASMYCDGQAS